MNTGGPAFPERNLQGELSPGMSLRDYFASMALQLAGAYAIDMTLKGKSPPMTEDDLARRAYRTADAMLRARDHQTHSQ